MEDSRWPKKINQWKPHGRSRGRVQQSWTGFVRSRNEEDYMAEDRRLAFGSGWTALGCMDPNKKCSTINEYQFNVCVQSILGEYLGVQ